MRNQLLSRPTIVLYCLLSIYYNTVTGQKAINKFFDPEIQKIYTYEYNRDSQNLYPYLLHKNSKYRAEAALAFSSVKDSNCLARLYPLLNDSSSSVRINTAFALGQQKKTFAESILIKDCELEKSSLVKRYILEALGRVSTIKGLNYLASFQPKDSLEETGQTWGIYRAGLKKITSAEAVKAMSVYINKQKCYEARLAAGHYFSRNSAELLPYESKIIDLAVNDVNVEVQMAFTRCLRNINTKNAQDTLIYILNHAKDYRVKVDAINSLQYHKYGEVYKSVLNSLLTDNYISVKLAAAQFFSASKEDLVIDLLTIVPKTENWRVRAFLLEAAMKHAKNKNAVTDEIKKHLSNAQLKYEKMQLINALLIDESQLEYIANYLKSEYDRDVILSAASTIAEIRLNKNFNPQHEKDFANMIMDFLKTDNPYLVREAAHFITNPAFKIKKYLPQVAELDVVAKKMRNAKDKTISNAINRAVEYLKQPNDSLFSKNWDAEYYEEPKVFKSFEWKNIIKIPANLKLLVKTNKGLFTMQMLTEEAPFSVSLFMDLLNNGFFNNMPFYRVIPNFVNQTGGAKDATFDSLGMVRIRSELALNFHRTATVNMASYGYDTESSHFSIMLCPTPWNDNNYTIFAKIIENMEVVHSLEAGDRIISISPL